jgi:23S rRNA (uracil1939-C5)-methyltransferase
MVAPINHALTFLKEKGSRLLADAYNGLLPKDYNLEIQANRSGELLFALTDPAGSRFSHDKMTTFFEEGKQAGGTNFSLQGVIIYNGKKRFRLGQDFLLYDILGTKMRVSDRTFVQVNGSLLEPLIKGVLSWADANFPNSRWLELHAGAGFFTLHLAEIASSILAVEESHVAVFDGKWNLQAAGRTNAEMIAACGEKVLTGLASGTFTHLLMDPPRAGITDKEIQEIVRIAPKKILYLSCHPPALVRDIKKLSAHGYRLRRVQPFDLFPQTGQIEVLAEMTCT